MRIVILARYFGEYCFRYANAMARRAKVMLIVDNNEPAGTSDVSDVSPHPNLTVAHESLHLRRRHGVSLMARALLKGLAFRPHLVHFQEIPDDLSPILMSLCRPLTTILLTIHDPTPHSGEDSNLPRRTLWLRNHGRNQAHVFVTHGEFCSNEFVRRHPQWRGHLITSQHGVLMCPKSPTPPSGHALFFGRMHKYKGVDTFADAAAILHARGRTHRLVIVGCGPELDAHRERLEGMPNVTVNATFVSSAERVSLFESATAVVLPYKDASQSGVLACAFGSHRPVIASRVGGLPDIVRHRFNGLLFDPGDATALAEAIEQVMGDADLVRSLSAGAAQTANSELNWEVIADRLVEDLKQHGLWKDIG